MTHGETVLKGENLKVSLGGRQILSHVSLEIKKGEMVGLIGPNGSGKSTLVKTLLGVLPREAGRVTYQGISLSEIKPKDLARKMAYMPQGGQIAWPVSVFKAVALGRIPYVSPWQPFSSDDQCAIQKSLQLTDTWLIRDRAVTELAGGEKTLVMLARALCVQSEILLADEPVAGLDPGHQLQVMELLRNLTEKNKSVLIVLHDLTLAARFCHRLILLEKGTIAAEGSPATVLTPENLKRVYGVHAKINCQEDGFYVLPWKRFSS